MSIKRSELHKIEANPTLIHIPAKSRFFDSEKEAYYYKRSLGNIVTKIDQWHLELDDMTESEKEERRKYIDKLIEERPHANEAQKELLRTAYYAGKDIWSVSVVSEKTPEEFYRRGYEIPMINDEINGWVPADAVKVHDNIIDQIGE